RRPGIHQNLQTRKGSRQRPRPRRGNPQPETVECNLRCEMDKNAFRSLVSQELAPLIEAKLSDEEEASTKREKLASFSGPCRLLVKPTRDSNYRLILERSQKFE